MFRFHSERGCDTYGRNCHNSNALSPTSLRLTAFLTLCHLGVRFAFATCSMPPACSSLPSFTSSTSGAEPSRVSMVMLAKMRATATRGRAGRSGRCTRKRKDELRAGRQRDWGECAAEGSRWVLFANRKSLVLEERIFFRNIPISNWVEHEISVAEGADLDAVARTLSVFNQIEGDIAAPRGSRRLSLRAG